MRIHVGDVTVAVGVLLTAPGMAGMCCTLLWGHSLHQPSIWMVVLGFVLAIAGLVPRFEQHQDGWTVQTEALLRARQHGRRSSAAPEARGPAGTGDPLTGPSPAAPARTPDEDPAPLPRP